MRTTFMVFMILAASSVALAADSAASPNKAAPDANKPASTPDQAMERDRDHERGEVRERLAERHEEYIEWLEKNYPNEAKELARIKEQDPEQYLHSLKESFEKYGRLAHVEKRNPELAKLLRQDIELKTQEQKIVTDIRASSDEKQKTRLTDQLRQLESKRFDLIIAQKQLRYQELNKKLDDLNKEIKHQEADLDKLKARKNEEIKKRVDDLINQTEEIEWD